MTGRRGAGRERFPGRASTPGGLPQEQIDAFFADAEDPDDYNDVQYIAYTRPPKEALQITIELAKLAPSRHQLCHPGICILEALIQPLEGLGSRYRPCAH